MACIVSLRNLSTSSMACCLSKLADQWVIVLFKWLLRYGLWADAAFHLLPG